MRSRIATRRARIAGWAPGITLQHSYPRPFGEWASRPRLLLVTPYAVHTPSHGCARRIIELTKCIADRFDIVLVTDEAAAYTSEGIARHLAHFAAVIATPPRLDPRQSADDWPARIAAHSHRGVRSTVAWAAHRFAPAAVEVECIELARLGRTRDYARPWMIALHDAYTRDENKGIEELGRFDRIFVTSEEDALLLPPGLSPALVPNGTTLPSTWRHSSRDGPPTILCMAPLRYAPNRDGLRRFLANAWPGIRRAVPSCRLEVLVGESADDAIRACGLADTDGMRVVRGFVDPGPWLARATITLNPLAAMRGSALKVVESLAAGRVVVATRAGARGFLAAEGHGLVVAPDADEMAPAIIHILQDTVARHRLEQAAAHFADGCTWRSAATQWAAEIEYAIAGFRAPSRGAGRSTIATAFASPGAGHDGAERRRASGSGAA